jgi:hypothetical protein
VADDKKSAAKISLVQVLASAMAAVTSTVALSYLGVAGTVVGAALAAVITVVGNYLYARSLTRTHRAVKTLAKQAIRREASSAIPTVAADSTVSDAAGPEPVSDAAGPEPVATTTAEDIARTEPDAKDQAWLWRMIDRYGLARTLAAMVMAVFLLVMLAVTTVEVFLGRTISDELTGNDSGRRTTFLDPPEQNTQPRDEPTPLEPTTPETPIESSEPVEPSLEPEDPLDPGPVEESPSDEPDIPTEPTEPDTDETEPPVDITEEANELPTPDEHQP